VLSYEIIFDDANQTNGLNFSSPFKKVIVMKLPQQFITEGLSMTYQELSSINNLGAD